MLYFPVFMSAQESWVEHSVAQSETVLAVAQKYKVDPAEIYRHNRFAIDSVSDGMVLKFPVNKIIQPQNTVIITESSKKENQDIIENTSVVSSKKEEIVPKEEIIIHSGKKTLEKPFAPAGIHLVKQGETLFGLAKQYNTTVEAIKNANANLLKKGLQTGQKITIPDSSGTVIAKEVQPTKTGEVQTKTVTHKVKAGETLYGLSKKYHLTVEEITVQNAKTLARGLQTGQVLTLKISEN